MSHVPHELAEEFPEFAEKLHNLKMSHPYFARRSEEYHQLNRQIHRSETNVEPRSDEIMIDLQKRRMSLKDEISSILRSS
jgi:uncharacterized protein YdcH (DUF465 family)